MCAEIVSAKACVQIFRAKGGRITKLVKNTCAEIYDTQEDLLAKEGGKLCPPGQRMEDCKCVPPGSLHRHSRSPAYHSRQHVSFPLAE